MGEREKERERGDEGRAERKENKRGSCLEPVNLIFFVISTTEKTRHDVVYL